MRFRLTIIPSKRECTISFNYQYYLSSAIYQWLEKSSPFYSTFLHDHGYSVEGTSKKFKHFCFSQLIIPKRKIYGSLIKIISPEIHWLISMPVEESLKHLVIGIFEKQKFYVEKEENTFTVIQVEVVPSPQWQERMNFRMISPLTVSVPEERNGKFIPHYLRPFDERLNDTLRKNILNKYKSLNGTLPENTNFDCYLDEKFILDRGGPEKISKLITVKEGKGGETKVRGFMCPITIEGNPELIKLAYESGLGEKGSMGFGMLEEIKAKMD